jgi:hypothetical protein
MYILQFLCTYSELLQSAFDSKRFPEINMQQVHKALFFSRMGKLTASP